MTSHILGTILQRKAEEVELRQRQFSLATQETRARVAGPVRGFYQALRNKVDAGAPAVIAEVKKASPSKGVIREKGVRGKAMDKAVDKLLAEAKAAK